MRRLASDFLSYLFTAGARTLTHDWGQKFHFDLEHWSVVSGLVYNLVAPMKIRYYFCLCRTVGSRIKWLSALYKSGEKLGGCNTFKELVSQWWLIIQGVADKSLAPTGRKQATETKLGIYSTHFPRSSIHFLALCSNFCKPLKKKKELDVCLSIQVPATTLTSAPEEKWRTLNCFPVRRTGGSPTGPDQKNRVGDQDNGCPGRPDSSGLQVPGEPGHCRVRTRPPW